MRTVKGKAPWEVIYYVGTWEDELEEGESIVETRWLADGTGLVLGESAPHAPEVFGALFKVWILGGNAGTTYTITNRITTSLNRKLEGRFYVEVS